MIRLIARFAWTALILWPLSAHGATFYVDPVAGNDAGSGSAGHPVKHVTTGIRLLHAGDTLVLRDGTYRGLNNMIGDYASPRVYPPSGTAAHPTTIRAEHVGMAVIDGEYRHAAFSSVNRPAGTDHLHIDGIHFRRGDYGVFNIKGTGNLITNCGFEDGIPPTSTAEAPIAYIAGGSSHTLVEDCWVWGRGRYGLYTSSTDGGTRQILFRRVVVRLDDSPPHRVTAGLRFYRGEKNAMENCIVLDSAINAAAVEPAAFTQGGGSSSAEPDHVYLGVIALNNPRMKGFVPEDGTATNTVTDSVFWGNGDGVFTVSAFAPPFTLDLAHLTIGANTGYGVRSNPEYTGMTVNVTDSLVSVPPGGSAFHDPDSVTGTEVYLQEGGNMGSAPGNPPVVHGSAYTTSLKYILRMEPGSPLGRSGVGATILYRTGASGTFRGDPGWNVTTTVPLWPFAHESLWAAKMRGYTASGPGGNRGFAALSGPMPLTDYVWGYLGNTVPPFGLTAVPAGNGVTLRWDASSAPGSLTGYRVYVGTEPGRYDLPGYARGKAVGTATSVAITGLRKGTTYYFAVTASDRRKGESGFSYEVSARP